MNVTPPIKESDNVSRYEVESRREIISILRGLRDANQLVSLIIDNGNEVIISAIVEVDEVNNILILDRPSSPAATRRLTKAPRIYFESSLNKIPIRFSIQSVTLSDFNAIPSLVCTLPQSLSRLQRREYYRVRIPMSYAIKCMVPLPDEQGGGIVALPVINISCRGILVLDEKQVLQVELGTLYSNCEMMLPGIELLNSSISAPISVTLQIRNSYDLVLSNHKTHRRIGCELMDLSPNNMLQIQKFITKLEREQIARQAGLG